MFENNYELSIQFSPIGMPDIKRGVIEHTIEPGFLSIAYIDESGTLVRESFPSPTVSHIKAELEVNV